MSRNKGNRNRRKVENYYRALGYIVANLEKTGKFTKSKDLFSDDSYNDSGFDSLAMRKGTVVLIQVKSNVPATQKFYKEFAKEYADEHLKVVVATWIDRKGLRLQRYEPDGNITEDFIRSKVVHELIEPEKEPAV